MSDPAVLPLPLPLKVACPHCMAVRGEQCFKCHNPRCPCNRKRYPVHAARIRAAAKKESRDE